MSIIVNGTQVKSIIYNGVTLDKVYYGSTLVWVKPASVEYTTAGATGTFTVPANITQITYCLIGGGGAGASYRGSGIYVGGGYAGTIKTGTMNVTPGQSISYTLGTGGAGRWRCDNCGNLNGLPGTASTFGSITAAGGAGGTYATTATSGYLGNSGTTSNCYTSLATDGDMQVYSGNGYAFGGKAGLGDGGGGGTYPNRNGQDGVKGGGGGGCTGPNKDAIGSTSGSGGAGALKISWGG